MKHIQTHILLDVILSFDLPIEMLGVNVWSWAPPELLGFLEVYYLCRCFLKSHGNSMTGGTNGKQNGDPKRKHETNNMVVRIRRQLVMMADTNSLVYYLHRFSCL